MTAAAEVRQRAGSLDAAAEAATALVSVALVVTTARLFTDASMVPKWLVVVGAIHVTGYLTRLAGLRAGWSVVAHLAVSLLGIPWLYLGDTLTAGLPTSATLDAARLAVELSFADFRTLVAPVPTSLGFELVLAMTFATFASFTQLAAFRGRAPLQAIFPPAGAFAAMSVFALDRHTAAATGAFVGAILLHLACHRALRLSQERWATSGSVRGGWTLVRTAAVIVAGASLVGAIAGPSLPGAGDEAVVDLRSLGRRRPPLEVGNPLVGVTNLLGERANVEMFRISSTSEQYWRMTALETYDPFDHQWKTRRTYSDVRSGARLRPSTVVPNPRSARFEVEILDLPGIWLPSPYAASSVTADVELRYDEDSGSVIAGGVEQVPRITYELQADVPTHDPAASPRSVDTSDVPAAYSEDPLLSREARAWLAEVERTIPEGATLIERARALQDVFRGFTYDLEVDYSDRADPVFDFLMEQRGFCQQFASTFAQMARVWGIPSRVAVGFTWGDELATEGEPGSGGTSTFVVRGRNAHAWPELYLGRALGWVAFEPTPGRGNPAGVDVTGVPPAQEPPASPDEVTAPTTTAPAPAEGGAPGTTTTTLPTALDPAVPEGGDPATAPDEEPGWDRTLWVVLAVVGGVAVVLGAWIALVASARERRRRAATSAADRVRLAWDDVRSWLASAGTPPLATDTPWDYARRAPDALELDGRVRTGLATLAEIETRRVHSPRGVSDEDAERATAISTEVAEAVEPMLGWFERFRRRLGLVPKR